MCDRLDRLRKWNCSSLLIYALNGKSWERGKRGRERGAKGKKKSSSAFVPQHGGTLHYRSWSRKLESLLCPTQAVRHSPGHSALLVKDFGKPRGEKSIPFCHCWLLYVWQWGTSSNLAEFISHLDSLTSYLRIRRYGMASRYISSYNSGLRTWRVQDFISNQMKVTLLL